jgi:hypothetical protein
VRRALLLAIALAVSSCRSPCPNIPKPFQILCQNETDGFDECYDKCIAADLPRDLCYERCSQGEPKPRPAPTGGLQAAAE